MRSFTAAFLVAMVFGALLTPLARRIALRLGAVSRPGGRHVHRDAIPRLGGLAICLAFFAPLLALYFARSDVGQTFRQEFTRAFGLFVGGCTMCIVGAVDDTRGLRALYKLFAQIAVAVFAFAMGFRIEAISLPLVGAHSMGVFALPVTVFWIVGVVNAVNLIDGLDGLAAGVVFFAGLTNLVVAYLTGAVFVAVVMAALLGSVVGFLFYNFNPARIFMGDSGSYFLGFILAAASLCGHSQKTSTAVSLLVPIVALGVPIFDTLFAMVRRVLERRPIFSADRGHIHHRLLDMGLTHRRAVLLLYLVSILFATAAIGVSLGTRWQVGAALLGASGVLIGLVRFLGYFDYLNRRGRSRARVRSPQVQRMLATIPRAFRQFAVARTEEDLLAALARVARDAHLDLIELTCRQGTATPRFLWTRPRSSGTVLPHATTMSYPLGAREGGGSVLRFGWNDEPGAEIPSDFEVLLQVLADGLALHLVRLRNPLVASDEEVPPSSTATVVSHSAGGV